MNEIERNLEKIRRNMKINKIAMFVGSCLMSFLIGLLTGKLLG